MWRRFCLFMVLSIVVSTAQAQSKVNVLASIEPLAQVLRELFEEHPRIAVDTLLLPQQNPHHAALTPGQARRVLKSQMVVWLGAEAEPHIADIIHKHGQLDVPLTSQKQVLLLQEGHQDAHHSHVDPHLWLAPQNIIALVQGLDKYTVELGLSAEEWQEAKAHFLERLHTTQEQLKALLTPYQDSVYLSHHDAWGYFATTFNLQRPLVVAANIDGEASSRRVVKLRQQMQQQQVKCVVAEPEARKGLLRRLCTGSCVLYEVDPLGRDLPNAHYTQFLHHLGTQFQACFVGKPQH